MMRMVKRSMLVLGNTWLLAAMSIVSMPLGAQPLKQGEILMVGMQTAGDTTGSPGFDSFTFLTLVDLEPGTRIYFTDTGSNGSSFLDSTTVDFNGREGLGFFEVNEGHLLRAGSVFSTADTANAAFVWKTISAGGAVSILPAGVSLLELASDQYGDQVYAFQSTAALPAAGNPLLETAKQTHLSAIGTVDAWGYSSNIPTSAALPNSLDVFPTPLVYRSGLQKSGATYFNLDSFGPALRDKGQWLTALDVDANWARTPSPGFVLPTTSLSMAGGIDLSWKGGSGTWDRSTTNWRDVNGNITRFLPQDNVAFGGETGGAVSVEAGGVLTKSFTINNSADSYSFTGGQISGESLIKSGAGSASIANPMNLTGRVTVNDGTLVLSGNNTATGTTLNGGKLVAGHNSALGTAGVTFNGGTLASDNSSRVLANPLTVSNVPENKVVGEHSFALTGGAGGLGTLQVAFDNSAATLKVSGAPFAPEKIDVNKGSLLLGASNVLGDGTRVQLSGGTLATDGFSDTVGALTLMYDSVIDLGSGSSVLQFANSRNESWSGTLRIDNWSGSGSGTDRLLFGNSFTDELNAGLTDGQLGKIYFRDPEGMEAGLYTAGIGPDGEVSPFAIVPEPNPLLAGLVCMAFLGWHRPRFRRR